MYLFNALLYETIARVIGNYFLLILQIVTVDSFYKQADYYYKPTIHEEEHAGIMYTTERSRTITGSDSQVMDPVLTPDFRIEEPPFTRYWHDRYMEEERPYRISPHYKQFYYAKFDSEFEMVGCTCCTVYKRLHLLGTCSVITTRHVVTTATSTELILRRRRHFKYLQNILGFWYDTNNNSFNSCIYASIARIHYHPKYLRPKFVNRSHPLPAIFDIAVWTATHSFYDKFWGGTTVLCARAGSHRMEHSSAVPTKDEYKEKMAIVAGYQFMKAYKRHPTVWFKYMVQTKKHVFPCPKVEWGWLHCIRGNWAKLGLDSGAPLFRFTKRGWRYSGLVGINVISMRLRSLDMIHYFQVLDSHTVLDFFYDAFCGYIPYEYLDGRFIDSKERGPAPFNYTLLNRYEYILGQETYVSLIPNY